MDDDARHREPLRKDCPTWPLTGLPSTGRARGRPQSVGRALEKKWWENIAAGKDVMSGNSIAPGLAGSVPLVRMQVPTAVFPRPCPQCSHAALGYTLLDCARELGRSTCSDPTFPRPWRGASTRTWAGHARDAAGSQQPFPGPRSRVSTPPRSPRSPAPSLARDAAWFCSRQPEVRRQWVCWPWATISNMATKPQRGRLGLRPPS